MKSPDTSILVPWGAPADSIEFDLPKSTRYRAPASDSACFEIASTRATEEMEGRASPRNPRVPIEIRSEDSSILEVANRWNAVANSLAGIPRPLSTTVIDWAPPPTM